MKKISTIFSLFFLGVFAILFSGCQSEIYTVSDSPQMFMGKVKYTGPVHSPFGSDAPYKYAFYDINNEFVAYIDFKDVLMSSPEPYLNKNVIVRGIFAQTDKGMVIRADNIKLNK